MINGLYNYLISSISKPYSLLLLRAKTRRVNATNFHKALAEDIQRQNDQMQATEQHLRKVGIRRVPSIWLREIKERIKTGERSPKFSKFLQQTDSKKFTAGQWLELSMYFLSLGLFQASLIARAKSHESLKTLSHQLAYGFIYPNLKISSFFDQGRWEQCRKVYRKQLWHEKENLFYKRLFTENSDAGKDLHQDYYNLVKDKKVAVIGPLAFDQNYSSEINNCDLIVELNALKSNRGKVTGKYNGNPAIVYYNNSRARALSEHDFNDIPEGTKYYVLKTDKYHTQLSKKAPCRIMPQSKTLTWNGTFSMMECTLSDLLLFAPSEVKVYGVDLYLSFNYDKSYGNEPPKHLKSITMNFTVHDIFTQFQFMKSLFERSYIIPDKRLERVLKLDLEGYAKELEKLYPVYLNGGSA